MLIAVYRIVPIHVLSWGPQKQHEAVAATFGQYVLYERGILKTVWRYRVAVDMGEKRKYVH